MLAWGGPPGLLARAQTRRSAYPRRRSPLGYASGQVSARRKLAEHSSKTADFGIARAAREGGCRVGALPHGTQFENLNGIGLRIPGRGSLSRNRILIESPRNSFVASY
jgi:hypothetical protein